MLDDWHTRLYKNLQHQAAAFHGCAVAAQQQSLALTWLSKISSGNMHSLLDMCLCPTSAACFLCSYASNADQQQVCVLALELFVTRKNQNSQVANNVRGMTPSNCGLVHRSKLTSKQQNSPKAAQRRCSKAVSLLAVSMQATSITLCSQNYPEALLDALNIIICSAFLPAQQSLFHNLLGAVQEQNKVRLSARLH